MRVLIVDGDDAFLEVLQSYMRRRGHETEIATNGLECTAILGKFVPEVLVVADDLLWGSDGGHLARLSEDSELATTPAILIGDDPATRPLPHGFRMRIFKSISKPFWLGELEASIEAAGRLVKKDPEPGPGIVGASL